MFTSVFNVVYHYQAALPSLSHVIEAQPFFSVPLARNPTLNSPSHISSPDQRNSFHKLLPTFVNKLTLPSHLSPPQMNTTTAEKTPSPTPQHHPGRCNSQR